MVRFKIGAICNSPNITCEVMWGGAGAGAVDVTCGMFVFAYRQSGIRLRDSITSMLLQGQMLYPYDCRYYITESPVLDLMI